MTSGLSVFNLSWDSNATRQSVEQSAQKAAQTVTSALDKSVGKVTTDVQRSTDKITAAIKDNTDKVTDAVKRSAVNNSSNAEMTAPVSAVYHGLLDMSKATSEIAQYLITHPDEMAGAMQAAKSVGQRFGALTEAAVGYDAGTAKLGNEVAEMEKTLDWCEYRFAIPDEGGKQCVPVFNSAADVVGAFGRLSDFN